jgi:ubiquinone/menaquinone biosynthesis C-methylase UbiE
LPLDGSVLEIGTGKGRFMVALAPYVKTLTTMDISAEEHRCARLNVRYTGVKTKIKYVLQDAAHLPWPDRTFDAVVTMNAMHHIPHFPQVLEEMQRVVKPGGKLVLADLSPRGFQIMARFHRSEGITHERHDYDFRDFQKHLRDRGWATRLHKGKLQEVLVATRPAIPEREQGAT